MPIYEFYCSDCHAIFSFLSKSVNTKKRPKCPRCAKKLDKRVSAFSLTGGAGEKEDDMADLPIDESKMERAMMELASQAESINEDDPKQAAQLMRKFSGMTGMEFGEGMEEALNRMEAGEDPEKIEAEMGDLIDGEDPFVLPGKKGKGEAKQANRRAAPSRDKSLYDM